jgi:hypothetical protein
MEATEVYLEKYLQIKAELEKKGELWRLRVTQEEFLKEIERLRQYEFDSMQYGTINEYSIQTTIENSITIMLMNKITAEEAKAQADRLNEASEKHFAEEVPKIIERLKFIETPLKFRDSARIYRWIFRKQITIDMLPTAVREEFVKSTHFKRLKI